MTASISEPSNLVPYLASDSASAEVSRLIYNGLVKYDKDLKLAGDLAERWDVEDGGLRIVFHLRPGVRWQDGTVFTAEDVEYTYRLIVDPKTPTPYSGGFEKVRSVRVVDPLTFEVVYKEPFSPGLASWGMGIVQKNSRPQPREPMGTGPYRLKKWKTGERVELEANADYFEGRPGIERIVSRVIPDQATTFLELQTGALDGAGLTPLQYSRQTDGTFFQKHYAKFRYPSQSYTYIGYNLESPLFADARVRRAIGLAIDKQELIDVTLSGLGRVATGPFLPGSWAYDPSVKPSTPDLGAARALLAEAGWADANGDGVLESAGKPFVFTMLTNQGNDARRQACEMIQKRLAAAGIRMKIQTVEWSSFLKEFIDKKRFDAVLLAWNLTEDPDIFDIFHSSKTAPGSFNFVSYKNADVDGLLERARSVFDVNERAALYHEVHRLIARDEPYTFLYVPDALPIVHRRFRGVEAAPAGIYHNFTRWSVDEADWKYRIDA